MSKLRVVVLLAFGAVATVGLRAQAPAAAPRPPAASNDAIVALVEEVRALRLELAALASASVRSQLLVTRVQLQEQRLMHLDRQRVEVASKLRETEAARAMFAGQLKGLESPGSQATAEQRRDAEAALGPMKTQLEAMQAAEATLRAEHDNVLNALSTEQSRWSDFNSRLDDLERALPRQK
jgi:hypothetical protein